MKILEKIFFGTVILVIILALALSVISKLKYGENKSRTEETFPVSATISASSAEKETYTACGCGCCGGTEPKEQCLYRGKGDDMEKIKQDDLRIRQDSSSCALAGCSMGVRYRYCD
ncbi:MAG: hypothetical protein WC878_04795 [Candidatus Paceibacterota bacterium]|jgi:hypothetical protein